MEQGRRTVIRIVTQVVATTELTLEVAIDDLDQQELSVELTELYGTAVNVKILSGSAIIRISAVLNGTSPDTFISRSNQIGDDELRRALGVPTKAAPFVISAVNFSIPYDQPCASSGVDTYTYLPFASRPSPSSLRFWFGPKCQVKQASTAAPPRPTPAPRLRGATRPASRTPAPAVHALAQAA